MKWIGRNSIYLDRAYFEFKGYGISDGSNYEMADIMSDTAGHSPYNHNTSTGSDGLWQRLAL